MEVLGTWGLVAMKSFDPEKMELTWMTAEKLLQMEGDMARMMKMAAEGLYQFDEDGTFSILSPISLEGIPEEEVKKAVEEGQLIVEDDDAFMVHKYNWKEENGTILIDSKEEGEVFGEKIDPWRAVEEKGNTIVVLKQYQLVKFGETPTVNLGEEKKEPVVLSDEMKAAVGTYIGQYTKMVCSDTKETDKPFKLELRDDGTGTSYRNDLTIKVPVWKLENGVFTMTEKFLGTIDYTGTLSGSSLSLFNDDPAKPMTYEYVYEKE